MHVHMNRRRHGPSTDRSTVRCVERGTRTARRGLLLRRRSDTCEQSPTQGTGPRPMLSDPQGETEICVRKTDWTSDHRHGHCIETARTRFRSSTGSELTDPTRTGNQHSWRIREAGGRIRRAQENPLFRTAPTRRDTNKLRELKGDQETSRSSSQPNTQSR